MEEQGCAGGEQIWIVSRHDGHREAVSCEGLDVALHDGFRRETWGERMDREHDATLLGVDEILTWGLVVLLVAAAVWLAVKPVPRAP